MTSGGVPELGSILSVWAHPDDESYCCAGIMAAAVRAGHRVVCVTATRGEQGSTDPVRWPAGPQLAEVRTRELEATLAELGVTEHHWLDYPDGGCADVDADEAIERIRALATEMQPDTVLTFGPDGGTWHPDHMAVSRWTTAAVAGTSAALHYSSVTPEWQAQVDQFLAREIVMMADKPPVTTPIEELSIHAVFTGADLQQKYRAMLCQQSQIGPLLQLAGEQRFCDLLAEEAFRDARFEPAA